MFYDKMIISLLACQTLVWTITSGLPRIMDPFTTEHHTGCSDSKLLTLENHLANKLDHSDYEAKAAVIRELDEETRMAVFQTTLIDLVEWNSKVSARLPNDLRSHLQNKLNNPPPGEEAEVQQLKNTTIGCLYRLSAKIHAYRTELTPVLALL